MTLLYRDDRFLLHETGQHPECPDRLRHVHAKLDAEGLPAKTTIVPVCRAEDGDVLKVHTPDHIANIRAVVDSGGGRLDSDTVACPDSADVAWLAAGSGIDAVKRVVHGEDQTALCLVRPPGHHALPDRAMGFCLLSNIAIAARTAVQNLDVDRVLIVDWDVHHGKWHAGHLLRRRAGHLFFRSPLSLLPPEPDESRRPVGGRGWAPR